MKQTDFAVLLTSYLTKYLPAQRNVSSNTIKSYRDTFIVFLRYCSDTRKWQPNKISLKEINDDFIVDFLKYLEQERHCCPRTRKQRLTALHLFFRYVQIELPDYFLQCQRILMVCCPCPKHSSIQYFSVEELRRILAQPNLNTVTGRRDAVLLSLLYDSGARVQELINLKVNDIRIDSPPHVLIEGKGRKKRIVPLMMSTVECIRNYMDEYHLLETSNNAHPLFFNRYGQKLSRAGIRYILLKYVNQSGFLNHETHRSISPHTLRHTKAMHLLMAKTPLPVIRDFLGHEDMNTTGIYVKANLEMKREALEQAAQETGLPSPVRCSWQVDNNLLEWLKSL